MSEIRDPIYGYIEPSNDEWKILDSPLLQRLRRIRQLAMAQLVYPGALHTRFEHSLGVFFLASKMAGKLKIGEDKKKIVKLAALLHDVGHGPFSHVSESVLELFAEDSGESSEVTEKIHEKITELLLRQDKELKRLIGAEKIDEVIGVLSGKRVDVSLMKQIISGPIDADKQDYLLRDSHFCGVKYGVYDYERLINTLGKYDDKANGDEYICFEKDGIHALEQFILAKYYMTWQVYRHRIRLISDEMIIRGIELGIKRDEDQTLTELYTFDKSKTGKFLNNYKKWWDDRLFNYLVFESKKGYAHDFFKRLYYRQLFKRVFEVKLKELKELIASAEIAILLQGITKRENKFKREKLEYEIARVLGRILGRKVRSEDVIINSYQVKSVKEVSRDGEREGEIIIMDKDKKKSFLRESTVFNSIDESMKEVRVEVYAPFPDLPERERKEKIKNLEKEIIEILKKGDKL